MLSPGARTGSLLCCVGWGVTGGSQLTGRTWLCPLGTAGGRMARSSGEQGGGCACPAVAGGLLLGPTGPRAAAGSRRGWGRSPPAPLRPFPRRGCEGVAHCSLLIGLRPRACPAPQPVGPQGWEGAGCDWRRRCRRGGTPPGGRGSPPGRLRLARPSAACPRGRAPDVVVGGKKFSSLIGCGAGGAGRDGSGPCAIGGQAAVGGARGAAGRGLAAAAGARPAGAPWCGRERSMGRRLLRALLCLLLLAGRGLLRDSGASATATAAHGESGGSGQDGAPGAGDGGAAGQGVPRPVLSPLRAVTASTPGPQWGAGEGSLVPARRVRHRHWGRLSPGAAPGAPRRPERCCRPRARWDRSGAGRGGAGRCSLRDPRLGQSWCLGLPQGWGARGSGPEWRLPPGPQRPLAALRR